MKSKLGYPHSLYSSLKPVATILVVAGFLFMFVGVGRSFAATVFSSYSSGKLGTYVQTDDSEMLNGFYPRGTFEQSIQWYPSATTTANQLNLPLILSDTSYPNFYVSVWSCTGSCSSGATLIQVSNTMNFNYYSSGGWTRFNFDDNMTFNANRGYVFKITNADWATLYLSTTTTNGLWSLPRYTSTATSTVACRQPGSGNICSIGLTIYNDTMTFDSASGPQTYTYPFELVVGSIGGCMDPLAINYSSSATYTNGTCIYTTGSNSSTYITSFTIATSTSIATVQGVIGETVNVRFKVSDDSTVLAGINGQLYADDFTQTASSSFTYRWLYPTPLASSTASTYEFYVDFNKDQFTGFVTGWVSNILDSRTYYLTLNTGNTVILPPYVGGDVTFIPEPCDLTHVSGCFYNALHKAFVPDQDKMKSFIQKLKDGFITKFPVGYFYVLYDSFLTPATSIPVFSATIPNGVVGSGASITLDLDHSLDYILNATTSSFINSSAPSSDTLYDITSPYWNILVYLALGFYVLTRLLGTGVVGNLGSVSRMSETEKSYGVGVYKSFLNRKNNRQGT